MNTTFNAKKLLFSAMALGALCFGFTSCDNDADNLKKEEIKSVTLDASSHTKWTYFSFEKGKVVDIDQEKYKESKDWDLAFLWSYPRTNGGTSSTIGSKGAVAKTEALDFSEEIHINPDKEGIFVEDATVEIPIVGDNGRFIMPPRKKVKHTGNTLLNTWIINPRPPFSYDNSIFIIRCANGKYAKVKMISMEDPKTNKTGYISFQYVYPFNLN